MKRVSSVLTALFMLCAMMFSGAPAEETVLAFPMEGAFFSSLWEGTPYDALARRLLNGLSPVYWDEEHLRYRQDDSVAEEILVADTQDGGREYLISFRRKPRHSRRLRLHHTDAGLALHRGSGRR